MKRLLLLTMPIIFITACDNQNKTDLPNTYSTESNTNRSTPPEIITTVDDPNFVMTKDTVSKNGPTSITRNILQDKNGNYWLATWEGIVQYDGKHFTNFTLKEGLRRYHVFSMLEDRTGKLWFGTIGGGVYRYDPSTSLKSSAFTLFTTEEHLAGNVILCIMEDKAGNIWFGTDKGVSSYNGYTFTNFTKSDGLNDNFVNAIAQDKNGKLWFGTNGGVSCYDALAVLSTGGKSFTDFKINKDLSFHNVRSIIEDKSGNIWIGSQEGLSSYSPSTLNRSSVKSVNNLSTNFIGYIYEDKKGILWLSEGNDTGMSLTKFDPSTSSKSEEKSFTRIINAKQVFGIVQDMSGNIWFGTVNGVCRYNPEESLGVDGNSFTYFTEKRIVE